MEKRSPLMLFRNIRPASTQVNRQPDRHYYGLLGLENRAAEYLWASL